MIKIRKIFALTLLIVAMLATACITERSKPDADIITICNAFFHGDEAALAEGGLTKEFYENEIVGGITRGIIASQMLSFTDEQKAQLHDALKKVLQRSTFNVTTISEEGDKATVKIAVGVFTPITDELVNSKVQMYLPQTAQENIDEVTANVVIDILNEMHVVGTKDVTIECTYDKDSNHWMPVDMDKFGEIMNIIFDI